MTLALFDLDNTLLAGDSDHAWGQFLVERDLVDKTAYKRANDQFYQDYCTGKLDIVSYSEFVFDVLARNELSTLNEWRNDFMRQCVEQMLLPKAFDLLEQHRQLGHTLIIITATNRFITEPIAKRLGVEHLIATEAAQDESGRFTGKLQGTACFQAGKLVRLQAWLNESQATLQGAWFYSDSRNDLPLLEAVTYPVAVDADETLTAIALERGWLRMSLRG